MNEGEEMPSLERRTFLKKSGMVLASALGIALGTRELYGAPFKESFENYFKYDLNSIIRDYANALKIKTLDDFALSGIELKGMRLCKPEEQEIRGQDKNPLKGSCDSPHEDKKNAIPCKEWFLAEYIGTTNYPRYKIFIFATKFKSEEDYLETVKKVKGTYSGKKEEIQFRLFSKYPFISIFSTLDLKSERDKQEHIARANLYQIKRGLEFVLGNY